MARLDEKTKEQLRTATVEVLLETRSAYLRAGASPLKHWDQLQDRMRAALRTTTSPEEWHTSLSRSLQLGAPNSSASSAVKRLVDLVAEANAAGEWLDLCEREHGYLIAMCRLISEQRREAREAAKEA